MKGERYTPGGAANDIHRKLRAHHRFVSGILWICIDSEICMVTWHKTKSIYTTPEGQEDQGEDTTLFLYTYR